MCQRVLRNRRRRLEECQEHNGRHVDEIIFSMYIIFQRFTHLPLYYYSMYIRPNPIKSNLTPNQMELQKKSNLSLSNPTQPKPHPTMFMIDPNIHGLKYTWTVKYT